MNNIILKELKISSIRNKFFNSLTMQKQVLFLFGLFLFSLNLIAQDTKNTWEIGAGVSIARFSDEDASFIGDKNIFQVPRLNLTMPINERLSVDGALSFNTIDDAGFIENTAKYFSMDASLRYNFNAISTIYPYVFAGGSLVGSERKTTPTLNVGAGVTYWFSERWGVNTQLYYKHSFDGYESLRSHIQGTLSLVYSFNWDNIFGSKKSPCDD